MKKSEIFRKFLKTNPEKFRKELGDNPENSGNFEGPVPELPRRILGPILQTPEEFQSISGGFWEGVLPFHGFQSVELSSSVS
jgi:hypothetical protein